MLPEMAVLKIPYESSLAPKQTVDGGICIHPMAGKKKSVDLWWLSWFFTKKYTNRMMIKLDGKTAAAGKEKEDKQT